MLDGRPSVGERYLVAAVSGHLRGCDIDVLLAAGWASSNPRKAFGLALWRLRAITTRPGFDVVLQASQALMRQRLLRDATRVPVAARLELTRQTLRWWVHPACAYCEGRGHLVVPGSATLGPQPCPACNGRRETPLGSLVPASYLPHAQWLAQEYDRHAALVFAAASRRLSQMMDIAVGA